MLFLLYKSSQYMLDDEVSTSALVSKHTAEC